MRRRCSWARVAVAAWVLATVQLPAPTAAATADATFTEVSYNITALPETCGYLRKDFGTMNFHYQAAWSSNASIPDGCTLEISELFMHMTAGGGSNASCEAAMYAGKFWAPHSSWSTVTRNAPGTTISNSDTLCAETSIGYFYIHNSCNQALSFVFTIRSQSHNSCQKPWYSSPWWSILLVPAAGAGALVVADCCQIIYGWFANLKDRHNRYRATRSLEVPLAPLEAEEAPPSLQAPTGKHFTERTPLLVECAPLTPGPPALLAAAQQPGSGLAV